MKIPSAKFFLVPLYFFKFSSSSLRSHKHTLFEFLGGLCSFLLLATWTCKTIGEQCGWWMNKKMLVLAKSARFSILVVSWLFISSFACWFFPHHHPLSSSSSSFYCSRAFTQPFFLTLSLSELPGQRENRRNQTKNPG